MDATDQLLLIVEVSVALAGFAGVVGSFQFRSGATLTRGDVLGLELMIHLSLTTAICAILPVVLFNFKVGESTIWLTCSSIGFFAFVSVIFNIKRKFRKLFVSRRLSRIAFELFFIAAYLIGIANLLNALNIIFHREYGPYFVALVLPNCVSAYMFIRLVLRPLWRTIHQQDAENSQVVSSN